jgi:Kef-type K+ transport system membrane component KefB
MIKHALLGFAISLGCLLPPIVHFVTGPLGPFIGGWFAGNKHKATAREAMGIGVLMGLFMTLPVVAALAVNKLWLSKIDDDSLLTIISIVILAYTAVLGTIGAMLGGYMEARSSRKADARVLQHL